MIRLPLAAALCAFALGASAADWRGFYTPTERARPAAAATAEGACIREILLAQVRHEIPQNLLLGIGLQEAGVSRNGQLTVWPWTANAEGEGRFFDSAAAAVDWVRARQAEGIASIDVGCMQINLRWHPDAFASPEAGFDPAANVEYAARLLTALYRQTGDWGSAAGAYHSFTPDLQDAYLTRLARNVEVANLRVEEFRSLAGKPAQAAPKPQAETGGIFWTAWLGREAGDGGGRSLYGTGRIEPILPGFTAIPETAG